MARCYMLIVYVPKLHVDNVKAALFEAGAGKLGNYDRCCWQTLGQGEFRPLDNSTPFIGQQGKVEAVAEYKVEMICDVNIIDSVITVLKESHPYETPAYHYWEVNI